MGIQFNSKGFNYGFVEFDDPGAAERAMQTLNGRRVHNNVRTAVLRTCDHPALVLTRTGNPRQLGVPV